MKHKAVIMITVEVHPVNDLNECTGEIISSEELKKYNLKREQLKVIDGFDKNDCLTKLTQWINEK